MNLKDKLRQQQLAECIIKIDGREIGDFNSALTKVSVELNRQDAAVCSLDFISVRDMLGQWNVQDAALFLLWRRISIEVVFGTRRAEIMRGFISAVEMNCPGDMNAGFTVTGQDESLLLDREHVQKTYSTFEQPLRDDALIKELLKPHWVGSQVDAAAGTTCGNLHFDGTPIRLIRDRAALNGYEFFIRDNKAYFGPPNLTGDPQPTILIYAGPASNCLNFSVLHDGHLPDSVYFIDSPESSEEVQAKESHTNTASLLGQTSTDSTNRGLNPFDWRLQMPRGSTLAEREARVKAKAEEAAWKLSATGELDGTAYGHVLQPSRTVKVEGVGNTYGGLWYVDEVKHSFSADGYRQAFRLIRNATGGLGLSGKLDALAQVRLR